VITPDGKAVIKYFEHYDCGRVCVELEDKTKYDYPIACYYPKEIKPCDK